MKIFSIFLILILAGCSSPQKPSLETPTYQIVDNSQTTIVVGDNNAPSLSATPNVSSAQTPTQVTETQNKSGTWMLWLILGVLTLGAGLFIWYKFFRK